MFIDCTPWGHQSRASNGATPPKAPPPLTGLAMPVTIDEARCQRRPWSEGRRVYAGECMVPVRLWSML